MDDTKLIFNGNEFTFGESSPVLDNPMRPCKVGDIRFNTSQFSTIRFWKCINAGTPGIWAAFTLSINTSDFKTITAGPGISIVNTDGNYVVSNTGILSAAAGPGIVITNVAGAITVNNTGVLQVHAGTNVTVTGTLQDPIVNAILPVVEITLPRVTNIAACSAISTIGFSSANSHICEIISVGDFYKFVPDVTIAAWNSGTAYVSGQLASSGGYAWEAIASGTNQVPPNNLFWRKSMNRIIAADGGGSWERLGMENKKYQENRTFYIDPSQTNPTVGGAVGDDENDGLAALTPIQTISELTRRLKGLNTNSSIAVNIQSGSTNFNDTFFYGFTCNILRLIGTVQTVVATVTLTGGTDFTFTNQGSLTSATSFYAGGYVSNTTRSLFARKTVGSNYMMTSLVSISSGTPGTVNTGKWVQYDTTTGIATAPITISSPFTSGDTIDLISLPTWPGVRANESIIIQPSLLDFPNNAAASKGSYRPQVCGFISQIAANQDVRIAAIGCQFTGGINLLLSPPTTFLYALLACSIGSSEVGNKTLTISGNASFRYVFLKNSGVVSNSSNSVFDACFAIDLVGSGQYVMQSLYGSRIVIYTGGFGISNCWGGIFAGDGSIVSGAGRNMAPYASFTHSTPWNIAYAAESATLPFVDDATGSRILY